MTLSTVTTPPTNLQKKMVSDDLITSNPELFTGIGKLANYQVNIHVDEKVQLVAQPYRRIPLHLRKKVEEELHNLKNKGGMERVEGPTPWVSPIGAVPKPKNPEKVRICVDMRMPTLL